MRTFFSALSDPILEQHRRVILLVQPEFWSGVGCFAYKSFYNQEVFGAAWSWCEGLNEEHFILVHWGSKSFEHVDVDTHLCVHCSHKGFLIIAQLHNPCDKYLDVLTNRNVWNQSLERFCQQFLYGPVAAAIFTYESSYIIPMEFLISRNLTCFVCLMLFLQASTANRDCSRCCRPCGNIHLFK